jgi:TonB family protein
MPEAPGTIEIVETQPPIQDLRLLVDPDPWLGSFFRNLGELFSVRRPITVDGDTAAFWPDVFVHRGLPWWRFLQSGVYHIAVVFAIWAGSRFLALQPQAFPKPTFTHADVLTYSPSEYIPPIDTRSANPAPRQKADPELSAQPIISLPPEAENHSQTILTPPKVKLHRDVPLPNIVAWSEKPQIPIAPAPVVLASETSRLAPRIDQAVVAPPPEVADRMQPAEQQGQAPPLAIIAPPPEVAADSSRRFGDLDVARSTVIAPAPQLSLDAQRAGRTVSSLGEQSVRVIAPPPSVGAGGNTRSGVDMIALSLHPSVTAPAEAVAGNRRGNFGTNPAGHRGATGAVGNASGAKGSVGSSSPTSQKTDLPAGLYVGKAVNPPSTVSGDRPAATPNSNTVNPNLIADFRPRHVSERPLHAESAVKLSEEERAVFGGRKFYSLSLSMPNLNSAGGSWIIRFAALHSSDSIRSDSRADATAYAAASSNEDLSAPSPTRKVDPAYPLELMRQNVGGTVILYAVIRKDGTVGEIRVLRSVDPRLDYYASQAISKWQFEPAIKSGSPVDVEATFWIPFRPAKTGSGF